MLKYARVAPKNSETRLRSGLQTKAFIILKSWYSFHLKSMRGKSLPNEDSTSRSHVDNCCAYA
jgi:hypothetical protein